MTELSTGEQSSEAAPQRCAVCDRKEADPRLFEQCSACGAFFHLNPRNDTDGVDCGDTRMTEALTVGFLCQHCLDRMHAQAAADAGGAVLAQPPFGAPQQAPLSAAQPPAARPPPRQQRPATQRRYRRIDGG